MSALLTVKEAAAFLRLTPDTVYRATKAGKLPHARIGRSIRFSQEALEDYLNKSTVAAPTKPTQARAPVTKL